MRWNVNVTNKSYRVIQSKEDIVWRSLLYRMRAGGVSVPDYAFGGAAAADQWLKQYINRKANDPQHHDLDNRR